MSKPRGQSIDQELFKTPLGSFVDETHSLVILERKIDWSTLEAHFDRLYREGPGNPPLSIRLILGLHILKYLDNLSDETVVAKFVENPYYQVLCGETYFQHQLPCDPSSMSRWRTRIGYKGFEKLLEETIKLALREGVVSSKDLDQVILDTTVQEKNIAFPTDARLYLKGIRLLGKQARKLGLDIKQSYKFVSKKLAIKYHNYQMAKQYKRARRCLRKLKTCFGRLIRDVSRQYAKSEIESPRMEWLLAASTRIFNQKRSDKNKLYSFHAPEVKCIAKGKAHKRYEFGNKVSIATTAKSSLVVGVVSFSENIFDGKTLADSLTQIASFVGKSPKEVFVDRGYRGYTGSFLSSNIYHQGQRRGISQATRKWLRRRSRIEPVIGHLKSDHRLGRNFLMGNEGDRINSILAGCAFNLRKVLRAIVQMHFFKTIQSFWLYLRPPTLFSLAN